MDPSNAKNKLNSWKTLSENVENVKYPENSARPTIHIIPDNMRRSNVRAYKPSEVSMGPIHRPHGSSCKLAGMEELKLSYSKAFLRRIHERTGVKVTMYHFWGQMIAWEEKIRACYEYRFKNRHNFLEKILVDCCFLLEFFLRIYEHPKWQKSDPLIGSKKENDMYFDLILLENQLPYFVLDGIYKSAGLSQYVELLKITYLYFKTKNPQNKKAEHPPLHFTDLIRDFMLPCSLDELLSGRTTEIPISVPSITDLWESGLTFEVGLDMSPVEIQYKRGKLIIPRINMYDTTELVLRNVLCFEQCHCISEPFITEYIFLLKLLIQSERCAKILIEKKIIVNWSGGDISAIPALFDKLSRFCVLKTMNLRYRSICVSLDSFNKNRWNRTLAVLWRFVYNTPWKLISVLAGAIMLGLDCTQTVIAIVSCKKNC